MGSKTTIKENTVQKNDPPSWAQPGLAELGHRITSIIPSVPGQPYQGDFIAQPGAMAQQLPGMYNAAGQLSTSLTPAALAAAGQATSQLPSFGALPNFTSAGSPGSFSPLSFEGPGLGAGTQSFASYNPTALQPVINAAIQPVMRQLTEQILPSLQSSAIESGAYGGTAAMQTLPQMAIRDAGRQAQEIAAGLSFEDFVGQQQRQQQAYALGTQRGLGSADVETGRVLGMADEMRQRAALENTFNLSRAGLDAERELGAANVLTQRLGMTPDLFDTAMRMMAGGADLTAQGAAIDQSNRQAAIDNELAKFDYSIRQPFQGLDVAAALLGQIASPWGTQTRTGTSTQSTGGLAPIVGGLAGLGMMAAGFPGIGGLFKRAPAPVSLGMAGG